MLIFVWHKALDDLGEKVCELHPFLCELCHEKGHFNFQCSGPNNNRMSTTSLYCDDKITLNQHDEHNFFWGVKSYLEKLLW
jgi:hypothetical protein